METFAYNPDATLYYFAFDRSTGYVYVSNGGSSGAFADASWDTYEVAMTERGTSSGIYELAKSAGLSASVCYDIVIYEQAGASPAITDQMVGVGTLGPLGAGDAASDIYHADIYYTRDDAGAEDTYKAVWFKNGVRITSGITSPTIQVVKEADGTDLIASTAMTEIGSTEAFKYTATTTARQTSGESCLVIVGATIDAAARTFIRSLGRDSTA